MIPFRRPAIAAVLAAGLALAGPARAGELELVAGTSPERVAECITSIHFWLKLSEIEGMTPDPVWARMKDFLNTRFSAYDEPTRKRAYAAGIKLAESNLAYNNSEGSDAAAALVSKQLTACGELVYDG